MFKKDQYRCPATLTGKDNPCLFRQRSATRILASLCFALLLPVVSCTAFAAKQMENIDRGLVAVSTRNGVYVGWRLLGTDPANIGFNVYRDGTILNASPITNSTNFLDSGGSGNSTYTIRPVIDGMEKNASESAGVWNQQYLTVNLQRPSGGTTPDGVNYSYSPNDLSVADLDDDGQYEIVVKWDPSNSKDNVHEGYTGNVYLDAYELNGTRMWRIDLGRNIRAGAHYTQFIVYDLDGDGKAEVACKTADGTRANDGTIIGNASADYRDRDGRILSGPEYLTIFNGETGNILATTDYIPARGSVSSWGDNYGNRVDRFLAGVAYLDGTRPSLLMARGYYTRAVIAAWDWRSGSLTNRWTFDSNNSGSGGAAGQGAHSLSIGDVDQDGRDEIVYGAATINDNGTLLYSTGLGHGDALHLSDMDPNRPGQEVFMVHECASCYGQHGVEMHDARTGEILWSRDGDGDDVGRGLASDIDPRFDGYEAWATRDGLNSATGQSISSSRPSINFGIWWDGDLLRELLDGTTISKWNYNNSSSSTLLSESGVASNNGSKANPGLTADIFGDWREEAIWRTSDNSQLRIYTTTAVTSTRMHTLMHDAQYRVAVAWQNVGYNQPPHPSFFIGNGMSMPPQPADIYVVGEGGSSSSTTIQEDTLGFCGVDGTVDSDHSGYTGSGFANTGNAAGNGVDWSVNAPASGNYQLQWRYANGATNRPGNVEINGANVTTIDFPSTGSWTSWTTVSTTVSLNAGWNTIRLVATTSDGLGNFDWMAADGEVQAANCDGSTSITVRARGTSGSEHINLIVGGSTVADWTLTTSYQDYTYGGGATGEIQVQFDNDGSGRDVVVDYIQVNGETRQAEDQTTNTAFYANSACGGGSHSQWMHCNGYISFGNVDEIAPSTLVIQESTGFCSVDGTVDSNHAGFNGSGFANTDNALGTGVNWSVDVPAEGNYSLAWQYANGSSTNRPGSVLINGTSGASVDFPSTGAWSTWASATANLTLSAGYNTIRLEATASDGLGNIDSLTVTGNDPQPVGCGS